MTYATRGRQTDTEPDRDEPASGAQPRRQVRAPHQAPRPSSRRRRARWFGVALGATIGGLQCLLAPPDATYLDRYWTGVAALLVAVPLNVVLHELGHLLAAFALALRPSALRVFGRTVWRRDGEPVTRRPNCVVVHPPRDARHLPLRMVCFALAGPAVNLLTAVALGLSVHRSASSALWHAAAVATAIHAAVLALANLWPAGGGPGGHRRDGRQAYLWARHPQAQRDAVFIPIDLLRAAHRPRHQAGEVEPQPDRLRAIAAGREPLARARAAGQLLEAVVADFDNGSRDLLHSETALLTEVARDPDVDPAAAAQIAGRLAHLHALDATRAQLTRQPCASEVDRTVQLAELARDRQPEHPFARLTLGMARGLQNRYEDSRRILSDLPGDTRMRAEHSAFLALVEASVGDLEAAERWAEQAVTLDPTLDTARLADRLVRAVRTAQSSR
jgi:hypothetical protein